MGAVVELVLLGTLSHDILLRPRLLGAAVSPDIVELGGQCVKARCALLSAGL
jgi:hypothetical protein